MIIRNSFEIPDLPGPEAKRRRKKYHVVEHILHEFDIHLKTAFESRHEGEGGQWMNR